ncbi:hypothetical protein KBTX_01458 [wastewater metagenome]|uniref:Nudix hydrolase domain-containing protein n=2 Tax=unclassified sequences TaxID=12908 RepID=A0A5B8R7P4_9ZZZZ|nr:NUDIX domain-containing protein [Arhodomonas sp. KWT]QEA05139.1 hypothetical protein KBTEX_01458 [uncultured organism]
MSTPGRFLGGVAALIENDAGHVLLMRRAAGRDYAPGVWECVTGRLQQGEGFETALHREVHEETGLTVTATALIGTSHFHRGPPSVHTELIGVIYRCRAADPDALRLSAEHDTARWTGTEAGLALAAGSHPAEVWLRRLLLRHRHGPDGTGFELG